MATLVAPIFLNKLINKLKGSTVKKYKFLIKFVNFFQHARMSDVYKTEEKLTIWTV